MKKLLLIIAAAVFVYSMAAIGYAAPTADVDILVTIQKTISIEVGGGPIDFGSVGVDQTVVSSSPITMRNSGSGADETITLSVTSPTGWTLVAPGTTPRVEQYALSFQFSPDGLGPVWDAPGTVSKVIPYNVTENLWVKFESPTVTNKTAQQTIQLTINAE